MQYSCPSEEVKIEHSKKLFWETRRTRFTSGVSQRTAFKTQTSETREIIPPKMIWVILIRLSETLVALMCLPQSHSDSWV